MKYITKFFKNTFKLSSPYVIDNTPVYRVPEEEGTLKKSPWEKEAYSKETKAKK